MAAGEIHVGDIGTVFELTIYDDTNTIVDISNASVKNIIFAKSDGSVVVKSGSFTNTGTDGKLQYITVSDDLNISGMWKIQAFITLPTGSWSSDIINEHIFSNL